MLTRRRIRQYYNIRIFPCSPPCQPPTATMNQFNPSYVASQYRFFDNIRSFMKTKRTAGHLHARLSSCLGCKWPGRTVVVNSLGLCLCSYHLRARNDLGSDWLDLVKIVVGAGIGTAGTWLASIAADERSKKSKADFSLAACDQPRSIRASMRGSSQQNRFLKHHQFPDWAPHYQYQSDAR